MRDEVAVRRALELVNGEYDRLIGVAKERGVVGPQLDAGIRTLGVAISALGWVVEETYADPDHPVNAFAELVEDLEEGVSDEVSEV